MDLVFKPSDPDKVQLQLVMTADVREWTELARSIGATASPDGTVRNDTPATRFVSSLSRIIDQAKSTLVSERRVTPWGVERIDPPAIEQPIRPPPTFPEAD